MAGIQYSTARTDATHAEATGAFALPHRAFAPSEPRAAEPSVPRANLQSAAAKNPSAGELRHMARARDALGTSLRRQGGTDVRSCRSLCLFAAPFDRVQGRVPVLRVGLGAFGSDRSDDRAGVSGLGVVPHRMTSSIFMASFAAPTA